MVASFLVWRAGVPTEGASLISIATEIERVYELFEGVSRAADWPSDVAFAMDPSTPRDVMLTDSFFGTNYCVVSATISAILRQHSANQPELLPVKIINHKGRVAPKQYAIVNPLELVDCIDVDASAGKWNPIDEDALLGCEALHIREDSVPAQCDIFRPVHWANLILVRRRLADILMQGTSGLKFDECSEFQGCL